MRLLGARATAQGNITTASAGFGRAKACIFLFMWGGPSQLETFDPKPNAPAEIRGSFQPIATAVPGMFISEHFQRVAKLTDRLAIVRSLTHNDPAHLSSGHATLTGHLAPVVKSDAEPPSERDTPHLGSVVARHASSESRGASVCHIALVGHASRGSRWTGAGQNGGWLGSRFDPMLIAGDPSNANWRVDTLASADDITLARLNAGSRCWPRSTGSGVSPSATADAGVDAFKQKALSMLGSPAARQAFDLSAESDEVRDRYGRNIHGQTVLLARRLVEHGVSLYHQLA